MSAAREDILRTAMGLRKEGRFAEALRLLDQQASAHPQFSRLYQERAHCLLHLGDGQGAIAALNEALRLNAALPACWDMLAQLLHRTGDQRGAAEARQRAEKLAQLPREVVMANALHTDGDHARAAAILRDYLARDEGNLGAAHLLARVLMESGQDDAEAERILRALISRDGTFLAARFDLSVLLLRQQEPAEARLHAEFLLRHQPENRNWRKQYAAASVALGDHEAVIDLYAELIADIPAEGLEAAELHLFRGNALKTVGRTEEAVAAYRAALAARPGYAVAWFSLANLKTVRYSPADIAQMEQLYSAQDTTDMDRVYLDFALAKAAEDVRDFARAWHHFQRGNDLRRGASTYCPRTAQERAAAIAAAQGPALFAGRKGWGHSDRAPIFVVGLPRSGSTLVEQILASHHAVEGTHELTTMGRIAAELCGKDPACGLPRTPEALAALSRAQAAQLGEGYMAETRVHRRLGRPFFIDKMPKNFWHLGLIHTLLPRATIIDIRREPLSCALANLRQLFGTSNQEFTYGVDHIAGHIRAYLAMMEHWDEALPGRVLRVHYEDLVADLEGEVRRLLTHCDLPFDPACLAFHRTERSVRTPSAEQVRQPINRAGIERVDDYAPHLGPLRAALGDALTRHRDLRNAA
ncbi:MAG: sulfotransferase family protein [Sphingomonadales bacterium 32-64-17]|nr:MAG: sulfotransferase family protein [Sphingomonadales bacterium 32-64-17]